MSTAFVHRADRVNPADLPAAYLASKQAAEDAVRGSGLPTVVIRPSVISGDSRSGAIARFQGLHGVVGALLRGQLPLLPVDADARIDFLPQDTMARCVADIVRHGKRSGEYRLTAGSAAPTLERIIDLSLQVACERGLDRPRPRHVEPEMVERLLRPVFFDALPANDRLKLERVLHTMALFATDEHFPSSLERLGYRTTGEQLEHAFLQTIRYWADQKGLHADLPKAA